MQYTYMRGSTSNLIMQKVDFQDEIKCVDDVTECGGCCGIIAFKTIHILLLLEGMHQMKLTYFFASKSRGLQNKLHHFNAYTKHNLNIE